MVWLLERDKDLLLCELRQPFGSSEYEFQVAPRTGPPETMRFGSPIGLINGFCGARRHSRPKGGGGGRH